MTISANYPSINPTLDLDFANSVALDPRVTFTRAGTGTYYNGSTSALAEQNLFLYSQTLGNAAWVSTNNTITTGITDPSSGTTAQTLTASAGNSTFYQTVTLTATAYTVSFYVQRVTGTGTINFTLDGTNFTAITAPTGSWVRYNITATPTAGAKTVGIQIVTSGDAINIAFGQLENRSSVCTYTTTTTAAITNYIPQLLTAVANQPRFDFNPTTRASLGLLMEQQSVNLMILSSQFDNAYWTKTNTTVTAATNISPDGTLNAQTLNGNATNAAHILNNTISYVNGNTYTCSIYAKNSGQRYLVLATEFTASTNDYVVFDLQLGTKLFEFNATGTITSVGNGWYRLTTTVVGGNSTGPKSFYIVLSDGTSARAPSFVGSASNGFYIWGAQVEATAFPTSYIPTVASQVTRAQDFATMTGTNFSSWFNNNQGSVYCSFDSASIGAPAMAYWSIDNNSSAGYNCARSLGTSALYVFAGVPNGQIATLSSANTILQNGYIYNNIGGITASGVLNGGSVVAVSSPTQLTYIPTQLAFGSRAGNNFPMTGHIHKFAYYPIATTSAQLQALTGS
jgi:hypothetical protein